MPQPSFAILFGGAVFPEYRIQMAGRYFDHFDFTHAIDSLHIWGTQDPYLANIELEPKLYRPGRCGLTPTILVHEEGHRVPRVLKQPEVVREFLARQSNERARL